MVRVQDALLEGTPDPAVLAWAATENRVLITNDRNTMVGFAYQRAAAGEPLPGLIATTNGQSIGSSIDDILLIAEYMPEEEIRNQIISQIPVGRLGGTEEVAHLVSFLASENASFITGANISINGGQHVY